jgi:List-Bact-rpt repeat protein
MAAGLPVSCTNLLEAVRIADSCRVPQGVQGMFQEKSFLNLFLRSFLFTILTVLSSPALVTAAQLILSWSDNSTNEVGFRIERRTGTTGTYAEIATVGVNTASYTDVNLPNGTTYCYRVRAYNAGGTSGYSNEQCATTSVTTSYTLTVAKSGTGGGVVTATGINCGTDCSELYASGTSVMLTAIPAGGSSFAGWSGTGWNGSGCQGTAGCTMTISSNTAVTATFVNNQADKVGIYRPSTGEWFLDRNGDGCITDKCVRSLADAGAVPVVGNWNRSGVTLLALFLPATAQWRLDINGNGTLEDCGIDNCLGTFGQGTDIPIAGKWSSTGFDRIGVFRPSNERWYMDVNGNGSLNNCSKDRCASLSVYRDGDLPVTGDWSGDGVTQVRLYRPSTGQWFLDRNGDRSWDGCRRDLCISEFGTAEDLPVTGDWNGAGRSKIGVFRPRTGEWLLDGNNQWDGCGTDLCLKDFGDVGDIPVAGKW